MQSVYQQLASANVNYGTNPPVAHDILLDVSFALIEPIVNTTSTAPVIAGSDQVLTPASMAALYVGAMVVLGARPLREVITVKTVGPASFTADVAHPHQAGEQLLGATFPSGQPEKPLFTQHALLEIVAEQQNDFLLRVRPVYAADWVDLKAQNRTCAQPDDTLRVERIALNLAELQSCSQLDLDCEDETWQSKIGTPRRWFDDEVGVATLGFDRLPLTDLSFEVWYSQRGAGAMGLLDMLLVPPVMAHYLKYATLAHIWSSDSEIRDPQRAAYCKKRVDLGVTLVQRFMNGVSIPEPQGRTAANFSPLVVNPPSDGGQNG